MRKRILALLLAFVMTVGLLPLTAWAGEVSHQHNTCATEKGSSCDHGGDSTLDCYYKTYSSWDGSTSLTGGNSAYDANSYYLTNDVTLTETVTVTGFVNLCLNGFSITQTGSQKRVFEVPSGATLTLSNCQNSGGVISGGRTAANCNGAGALVNGSLKIFDRVTVSGNETGSAGSGGGVYVGSGGKFYMAGGTITGNSTARTGGGGEGGGVCVAVGGTFIMYSGAVTNNCALVAGGGVSIHSSAGGGTFELRSGTITGNSVYDGEYAIGGGVYAAGIFKVGDIRTGGGNDQLPPTTVVVKDNTVNNQPNNVLLGTGNVIQLNGILSDASEIGVRFYKAGGTGQFIGKSGSSGGWQFFMWDKTPGNYFTSDEGLEIGVISGDGANAGELELKEAAQAEHTHRVCGAMDCSGDGHEQITWTAWDKTDTLPAQDGNYYLTGDVTLSQTWALGTKNVKLDLNGHSVTSGPFSDDESLYLIKVDANGSLTVTDCKAGPGISASSSTNSVFGIYSSGDVTLTGGAKLHAGSSSLSATAVKMKGSGHLTVSGNAEISATTTAWTAYGVENDDTSTATMTGNAKIDAESAQYNAYGIYNYGTSVVNGNATITATSNASSATFYACGIEHRSNSSGTVTVSGSAKVTAIGDSGATSYGIYNNDNSRGAFIAVTENAAVTGARSGVYLNKGVLNLSGAPTITGGAEYGDVTLVYESNGTIAITGALTYAKPISVYNYQQTPFTSGWSTRMAQATPADYFVPTASGYDAVVDESTGELKFAQPQTHTHAVSVGCETDSGTQVEFTEWNTADALPDTAGHYALTTDVTLTGEWEAPRNGETTLCLNGHAIRSNLSTSTTHGITVPTRAILNICDCSEGQTGAIVVIEDNNIAKTTSAIYNSSLGTLNLYGGNVLMTSSYNCSGLELSGNSNICGGTVLATLTTIARNNYNPKVYGIDTYSSDKNIHISGGVFKANCTASNASTNEALRCYGLNVSDYNNPNLSVTGGVFIGKAAVSANQQITIKATGGIYSTDPTGSIDPSYTARKITASDPGYRAEYANYYVLKPASAQPTHSHAVSVGGADVIWTAWDGSGAITYTDNTASVYLTQNVIKNENISVPAGKTLNLCLNGFTVSGNVTSGLFSVAKGGELHVCDCSESRIGKIYCGDSIGSMGVFNQGVFVLESGTVAGEGTNSAGVYNYSTCIINDGTVTGRYGICNIASGNQIKTFIKGGTVTGTAEYGVYSDDSGVELYLSGAPTITGAKADIYTEASTSNICADNGAETPTPYSGKVLSLGYPSPLTSGSQVVRRVTQATKDKFKLADQSYGLTWNQTDQTLVITASAQPAHTHAWAAAWSKNDTHHWHNCTAQGCDVTDNSGKDGYAGHTKTWVSTNAAQHWQTCATCGWTGEKVSHVYSNAADTTCNICGYEREVQTYEISGTVTDSSDSAVNGATVKLMQGKTQVAYTSTDGSGNYSFAGVVPGLYNVVATQNFVTKTILVEITDQNAANQNIKMPDGKKNSVVEVKNDTPAVVVGGVDAIAEAETVSSGETVTVKLTVEKKEAPTDKTDIDNAAQGKTVELYLDLSLVKTVQPTIGDSTNTDITDTQGKVLAVVVPYDFTNKTGVTVYRKHGTENAAALTELTSIPDTPADGTFYADGANGRITIYATKFSTYAIGYTAANQTTYTLTVIGGTGSGSYAAGTTVNISAAVPSGKRFTGWTGATVANPNSINTTLTMPAQNTTVTANFQTIPSRGGGGGWSGPTTYTVETPSTDGGKVFASPKSAASGTTVTLTITPDEGYEIGGVTVIDKNGKQIAVTDKGDGKYTFTMPSGKVTVTGTFTKIAGGYQDCPRDSTCPLWPYTDTDLAAWYHDGIHYCVENGLMGGYGNSLFGPNDNLSRAQFAQLLFNKEDRPVVDYLLQFEDVPNGAWYTEAVRWAAAQGVVSGYGNGRFGPNDNITREQLAVVLWRYAGTPVATNMELHFTDADEASGYALDALRWAVENGIINGKSGGILDSHGLATRAETAQILKRFMEK